MASSTAHMGDLALTVKCLTCKSTYKFKNVSVTLDVEDNTFEFECYTVGFDKPDGTELYFQDLCGDSPCAPRFSVFGRLSTGDMFALPHVVREWHFGAFRWITRPDSHGAHLAIKAAPTRQRADA